VGPREAETAKCITPKRGLASPCVHSAFATTRRWRLQLLCVLRTKFLEAARRLAGPLALRRRLLEFALDLGDEPVGLGQSEQKVSHAAGHRTALARHSRMAL
jgi:hypothetical protein